MPALSRPFNSKDLMNAAKALHIDKKDIKNKSFLFF